MEIPPLNARRLRVFCIEDNPLIVLHLQMMIEEIGHVFAGSSDSFVDLRARFDDLALDVALVDIDLADGRTGGEVVDWLMARKCPSIFVTGQELLAMKYSGLSTDFIVKPVTADLLKSSLNGISDERIT